MIFLNKQHFGTYETAFFRIDSSYSVSSNDNCKNEEFVEPSEALTLLQRKITDMKQEEMAKVRKTVTAAKGEFVNPI